VRGPACRIAHPANVYLEQRSAVPTRARKRGQSDTLERANDGRLVLRGLVATHDFARLGFERDVAPTEMTWRLQRPPRAAISLRGGPASWSGKATLAWAMVDTPRNGMVA